MNCFTVRTVRDEEIADAIELAKRVFLEFEAPEYSDEGVRTFLNYADDENFRQSFLNKKELFLICLSDKNIIGMINTRGCSHISMLFVDKLFHRQGVATLLIKELFKSIKERGATKITVNSSPFAIPFYHRCGFKDIKSEQLQNGIRFTPMECEI